MERKTNQITSSVEDVVPLYFNMRQHEWITVKLPNKQLKICYWCGQCKDRNEYSECSSRVKLVTKDKKLKMYIRD